MSRCTCSHPRQLHRRQVGRCLVANCSCLYAPKRAGTPRSEQLASGRATVDESGLVVAYSPPAPAQRTLRQAERTKHERRLWRKIAEAGLPPPDELEYRWARAEGRQYRADAFYRPNLLIEVDGGIWARDPGRHNRGAGFEADHSRDNLAVVLGFRVLRFTERQISSGEAVRTIERALGMGLSQPQLIGGASAHEAAAS